MMSRARLSLRLIDVDANRTDDVTIGIADPRGRCEQFAASRRACLAAEIVPRERIDHPGHQRRVWDGGTDLAPCQGPADRDNGVLGLTKIVDDDLAVRTDRADSGVGDPPEQLKESRKLLG